MAHHVRPLRPAPAPLPAAAPPEAQDGWLERWMRTTADLARLQYAHRMVDAVIDEVDGREIRIGDQWLADFASCNYLGLDLDREVIDAVPAYLDAWGTHPSWSRLLGSPGSTRRSRRRSPSCSGRRTCSSCPRSPTSTCR